MDRTLVSWNVPNLLTINLMGWLGFLLLIFVVQFFLKKRKPAVSQGSAGGTEVADVFA